MKLGHGFGIGSGRHATAVAVLPTAGLVDHWRSDQGFYTDLAGTTAPTTDGQNLQRWNGSVNGVPLKSTIGGYYPKYKKDSVKSGNHAVDMSTALFPSDAVAGFDRAASSVFAVVRRSDTTKYTIANFLNTGGDFSSADDFWLNDGLQRPAIYSPGNAQWSHRGYPLNQWVVLGVTSGTDGIIFWLNGLKCPSAQTTAITSKTYYGISIGLFSGTFGSQVAELLLYNRRVSDVEAAAINSTVSTRLGLSGTVPTQTTNLVFSGNSITHGLSAAYKPYTESAAAAASVSAWDYQNYGQDGATTDLLLSRDTTLAPSLYNSSLPAKRNVVVLWEGTNYLGNNGSAASLLTCTASWVSVWRNAGFKAVVPTVINRSGPFFGGQTSGGFATAQSTVNSALLTNSGGIYGDVICDLSSVASVGSSGDGVHPTQSGHDSIGPLVGASITAAMA